MKGKNLLAILLPNFKFTPFQWRVYEVVIKIPYGKTMTYGEVAQAVGGRTYSRAVGQALGKNPLPLIIPCHRVVRKDGSLGGFMRSSDSSFKKFLLALERSDSFMGSLSEPSLNLNFKDSIHRERLLYPQKV